MKVTICWCGLMWFALIAEQARPDLLPSGSVVIPTVVVGIFWTRSPFAILAGGTFLLFRWILTPVAPPVEIAAVLVATHLTIIRNIKSSRWRSDRNGPSELQHRRAALMITLLAMVCLSLAESGLHLQPAASMLLHRAAISTPVAALMMLITAIADGLGMRQRTLPV